MTISTSEAMQVMFTVQKCHPRTAPRMDDEQVVREIAKTWAKLFNTYRLELRHLTDAVEKRATTHAEAPEPAEIISFARDIRREEDAKHGPSAEYEALCESKAEDAAELEANRNRLAAIVGGIVNRKAIDA